MKGVSATMRFSIISLWLMVFAPVSFTNFQMVDAWAKDSDVKEAVKLYKSGDTWAAKNLLLKASVDSPENYVANYYLGIIYLEVNEKKAAFDQWKEYVRKAPNGENVQMIRKNLTQLEIELAKEYAKNAVWNEDALKAEAAVPNSLAVVNCADGQSGENASLSKGMAAMLTADLAKVKGLRLVERVRVQALMDEMKPGAAQSGEKAPHVGKLLKAQNVAAFTYSGEENKVDVASSVFSTKESKEAVSAANNGNVEEFWDLEKKAALNILAGLGYKKDEIPADVYKVHTKNFEAFKEYSMGLDRLDKGELDGARQSFQRAVTLDPDFELAEHALGALPKAFTTRAVMASIASIDGSSTVAAGGVAVPAVDLSSNVNVLAAKKQPKGDGAGPGHTNSPGTGTTSSWLVPTMIGGAVIYVVDEEEKKAAAADSASSGGGGGGFNPTQCKCYDNTGGTTCNAGPTYSGGVQTGVVQGGSSGSCPSSYQGITCDIIDYAMGSGYCAFIY